MFFRNPRKPFFAPLTKQRSSTGRGKVLNVNRNTTAKKKKEKAFLVTSFVKAIGEFLKQTQKENFI